MAARQASFFTALFLISLMFRGIACQQCHAINSIYQMMLKGHTYKTFKTTPGTPECRDICLADDRCQSFNVVTFIAICELNNRTKEARPEDFVKDEYRYYMAKGPKRVPLGSRRELPAESCKEIKASEGEQAVSGNYWLDSTRSGNSILARCDMKTKVADYCVKHQCQNDAKCVNRETNYSCACNSSGWTGKYCEKDINECKEGLDGCHVNAICNNTEGSYNCTCKPGFIGDGQNSCKDINECKEGLDGCHVNAICNNTEGSYNCTCKPGFIGDGQNSCKDINECKEGLNGCHVNAICNNTEGSYNCTCKPGFIGDGQNSCKDINECKEGLDGCHVNAICNNTEGSYNCTCKPGFIGDGQNSCRGKECGPVGVTDNNVITDARFTATSVYSSYYYPYYGRLHETRGHGAWCPRSPTDRTDYLQVDMGVVRSVCAVATQGELAGADWTTSYRLQLSTNDITWNTYKETSIEKVFTGNSDQTSIVKHSLRTDFKARYVRFYPVTYHNWPCLRVEIFELK
ncbi:protein kinase C-binding protein NELL2-like isoform X5 [Pocillopora verrucosa]|uniref:protein kinase C-binding protein NELL2-like isoform X5 n=1 Tax=Pocillopora verrucosa TaxID=203993 RepID=UPI00333FD4F2